MTEIGRFLVFGGLALAGVGAVVWLLGRTGFQGLPGDIHIENQNVRVYFPIATCLAISLLLSGALWLWLSRR